VAVALAHAEYGSGSPVIILHGLFGSSRNWTSVAHRLAERFHVFALDLRNHGASPWSEHMGYRAMAEDVAAFMAAHDLPHAALLGHSMGGKVAMTLALALPKLVDRLVVVDIAPVPRPALFAPYVEAMCALDLRGVKRRADVDALLMRHIANDAERQFLLQNLVPGTEGWHWRLNLNAILADMDEIADFPEFLPGVAYRGPTLLIRGGRSDYVADAEMPAFDRLFPNLQEVTIAEAGHWVHADRPEEYFAAVLPFLGAT